MIVGGQSRGAWNALQMLQYPGLADVVIAVSPASQGAGDNSDLLAQLDDLRGVVADVAPGQTRLAFVQFSGDAYASDEAARERLIERLRPRLGALLTIAADLVTRTLLAGIGTPVGVVTAVVGGPFLLYLLTRTGRENTA